MENFKKLSLYDESKTMASSSTEQNLTPDEMSIGGLNSNLTQLRAENERMKKEDKSDLGCLILGLICIAPFIILMIASSYSQPQKKAHTLTNEQIMVIYRQAYLNGYNARGLTYEQFKLRMTADSLKMADLMR